MCECVCVCMQLPMGTQFTQHHLRVLDTYHPPPLYVCVCVCVCVCYISWLYSVLALDDRETFSGYTDRLSVN